MKPWKKPESQSKEAEDINTTLGKPEYFFAVRKLGLLNPSDYWEAYQIELMAVRGDKIVKRWMYDKPDTKQMVLAKMELMMNPDSPEIPEDAQI